jgi:hypothetical protein
VAAAEDDRRTQGVGGAKAADLGTIKGPGGIKQVAYKGHPLYAFAADTESNPISGEGVDSFFVLSPSGTEITKATKTTTTSTSSSAGGYGYCHLTAPAPRQDNGPTAAPWPFSRARHGSRHRPVVSKLAAA